MKYVRFTRIGVGIVLGILAAGHLADAEANEQSCLDQVVTLEGRSQESLQTADGRRVLSDIQNKCEQEFEDNTEDINIEYALGKLFLIQKKFVDAERFLRQAAEKGQVEAQYTLGITLLYGLFEEQRPGEGLQMMEKAGESGSVKAQSGLGQQYLTGRGVKRDFSKAAYWLDKAADQGDVRSIYHLGVMSQQVVHSAQP